MNERIDSRVWELADQICDAFSWGDPNVSLEQAQEAAIKAMKASRTIDARHSRHFSADSFALARLRQLGIDPETLTRIE